MRASPVMAAMPGFWRRTLEHMRRQTAMAIKMDGINVPTKPFPLMQFSKPEAIKRCKVMSDKGIGGFSKSNLTFEPGNAPATDLDQSEQSTAKMAEAALLDPDAEPPHALFKGHISTDLPVGRPDIQRTGFAGWRTRDLGYSVFGRVLWDLVAYGGVALRVKSDGRKYFINIQTEGLVPTDLHQHILPALTPGTWETVIIPFSAFVRTNHGLVVEPQKDLNTMKVKSIGIALTDRIQGPFELRIADVYATNMSGQQLRRSDSGFDLHDEPAEEQEEVKSWMDDSRPKRKSGEREQILM